MIQLGPAMPDLTVRDRRAELMDDPGLEPERRLAALRALATVNRLSLTGRRVWREVAGLHARLGRTVRVLDLACGGADVLVEVAARAARAGVPVDLRGCDVSAAAVAEARRAVAEARVGAAPGDPRVGGSAAAPVIVSEVDVVEDDLPVGYDLLVSSLFLHHLERSDAVSLLRRMSEVAGAGLLVQDLRRTRLGYLFAWIGLYALTRSDVARVDGLRSVRAAFTLDEARALCEEAGIPEAAVRPAWPQRFTIRWTRTGGES